MAVELGLYSIYNTQSRNRQVSAILKDVQITNAALGRLLCGRLGTVFCQVWEYFYVAYFGVGRGVSILVRLITESEYPQILTIEPENIKAILSTEFDNYEKGAMRGVFDDHDSILA